MDTINSTRKSNDWLIYIISSMTIAFFFTNEYIIPAMVIIVGLILFKWFRFNLRVNPFLPIITILIVYCILQVLFTEEYTSAIKEISRLLVYIAVVFLASNLTIDIKKACNLWLLFLLFCTCIQVAQFFHLFDINSYLSMLYGESPMFERLTQYENLIGVGGTFRSGAIFYNSNQYIKIPILAIILLFYSHSMNSKIVATKAIYIWTIIAFTSILLSGSRTGMLSLCFVLFFFFFKKRLINFQINLKLIVFAVLVFSAFLFILMYNNLQIDLEIFGSRTFQFSSLGSLQYKIDQLINQFVNASFWNFLFGMGPYAYDSSNMGKRFFMDSDIGDIFSYYGFIGIVYYCCLAKSMWNYAKKNRKAEMSSFYYQAISVVFVINGLTSGFFFNLRLFPVLLMFLLPKFYIDESRHVIQEREKI